MDVDIVAKFERYRAGRARGARYASFDYCYNYFQSFRESGTTAALTSDDNLELSCLHLGFFLASWGMFRGSGDLYENSLWGLVPMIELLASEPMSTWELDVPSYGGRIEMIRSLGRRIGTALPVVASETLVTKTMLGVFGCVPALDLYFKRGFEASTFGPKMLSRLHDFYTANAEILETLRIPTLDFRTGNDTPRTYPMGKILDMIFFQRGWDILNS